MPNIHYYKARAKWATGALNWVTDDIRGVLVKAGHVADLTLHEFLSDIPAGSRMGTPVALTGKLVASDGRCTANSPLVFLDPPTSGSLIALVLYKHTGVEGTSPLLIYMDEAPLPISMSGAAVNVTFPAAGIFVL